jgi:hypothetical protein
VSREVAAFRVKTLICDLSVLQTRFVSALLDILLQPDGPGPHALEMLKENREFMKRLLDDADKIIETVERAQS